LDLILSAVVDVNSLAELLIVNSLWSPCLIADKPVRCHHASRDHHRVHSDVAVPLLLVPIGVNALNHWSAIVAVGSSGRVVITCVRIGRYNIYSVQSSRTLSRGGRWRLALRVLAGVAICTSSRLLVARSNVALPLVVVDVSEVLWRGNVGVAGETPALGVPFICRRMSLRMHTDASCHILVQTIGLKLRDEAALLFASNRNDLVLSSVTAGKQATDGARGLVIN